MSTVVAGCLSVALYLFTTARILRNSHQGESSLRLLSKTGLAGALAIFCHGVTIHSKTVTDAGLNLDVYTVASIVAWLIALLILFGGRRPSIASLSLVVFPFSSILVGVSLLFSADLLVAQTISVRIHIALSLLAYSLFSAAALQAIYIAVAEHKIKNHNPIMDILPPLRVMEELLFQITSIAFILLTLGLIVGVLGIENILEQHLSHKIVFSIIAWLIFSALLIGRYLKGWRGKKATYLVIGGSVCLATGFLGSKFVLEVLLVRI